MRTSPIIIGVLLATTGCANMTPTEQGVTAGTTVGGAVATGTYYLLRASGVNNDVAVPLAASFGVGVGGAIGYYAYHEATLAQQRASVARAKEYYASLTPSQQAHIKKIAVKTVPGPQTQGVPVGFVDTKTWKADPAYTDMKSQPANLEVIKTPHDDAATFLN